MPANGNLRGKGKARARIPSPEPALSDEDIEHACNDDTHELSRKSFLSTYLKLNAWNSYFCSVRIAENVRSLYPHVGHFLGIGSSRPGKGTKRDLASANDAPMNLG